MTYLFRGLLIGLIFGVPAGAVGALTIQRTIKYGFKAGLLTGIGSSIADVLYACVGVFSVTLILDFIFEYQQIISFIGALIITIIGIFMLRMKNQPFEYQPEDFNLKLFFGQSFLVALTNPATVFSFFLAFTTFGISTEMTSDAAFFLILGIFLGTVLWWLLISFIANKFRNRMNDTIYKKLNKAFACLLFLFAALVIIRTL